MTRYYVAIMLDSDEVRVDQCSHPGFSFIHQEYMIKMPHYFAVYTITNTEKEAIESAMQIFRCSFDIPTAKMIELKRL